MSIPFRLSWPFGIRANMRGSDEGLGCVRIPRNSGGPIQPWKRQRYRLDGLTVAMLMAERAASAMSGCSSRPARRLHRAARMSALAVSRPLKASPSSGATGLANAGASTYKKRRCPAEIEGVMGH